LTRIVVPLPETSRVFFLNAPSQMLICQRWNLIVMTTSFLLDSHDSLPSTHHPLFHIFEFRLSVNSILDSFDDHERAAVSHIPFLDRSRQERFVSDVRQSHSIAESVSRAGIKTTADIFELGLIEALIGRRNPSNPQLAQMAFWYFCLEWVCQSSDDHVILTRILRIMNGIRDAPEGLSFWFSLVVQKGFGPGKTIDGDLCLEFLSLVGSPGVFSPVVFPFLADALVVVTRQVGKTMMPTIQKAVQNLIREGGSLFVGHDCDRLLNPFLPSIISCDPEALDILGGIAKVSKSPHVMDVIGLVYQQIQVSVVGRPPNVELVPVRGLDEEFFPSPKEWADETFEFYDGCRSGPVSYDAVVSDETLDGILGQELSGKIECMHRFFSQMPQHLKADFKAQFHRFLDDQMHLIEYALVLLVLTRQIDDPDLAKWTVELLVTTDLFAPSRTIFHPELLNAKVNFVRSFLIEVIAKSNKGALQGVLESAKRFPFMVTEYLMRVLMRLSDFDLPFFAGNAIGSLIAQTAINLSATSAQVAGIVRASFFDFWFTIAGISAAGIELFAQPFFVKVYMHFAFERGLTQIVFLTLRKTIAALEPSNEVDPLCTFYCRLLAVCRDRIRNPEYAVIIHASVDALITGISFCRAVSISFVRVLDQLASYLAEAENDKDWLADHFLAFLLYISHSGGSIPLNSIRFGKWYRAMQSVWHDSIPHTVVARLFAILSADSFVPDRRKLFIEQPFICLLLFALFAQSHQLCALLFDLVSLCDFSWHNALALYRGGLGRWLLQMLYSDTISVLGVQIALKCDLAKARSLAVKLLVSILEQDCDFGIASQIPSLLSVSDPSPAVSEFFDSIFTSSASHSSQPMRIPLETRDPILRFSGIPWDSMKTSFSLDMVAMYDDLIAIRFPATVTILQLADTVNTFRIYLRMNTISASFTTPDDVVNVPLFRNTKALRGLHLTFVFARSSANPSFFQVVTRIDGLAVSDTILKCNMDFNANALTGTVGGCDGTSCVRYLILKDVRLYARGFTDADIPDLLGGSREVLDSAIFASERPASYETLAPFHRIQSLLHLLADGDFANDISELCSPALSCYALQILWHIFLINPARELGFSTCGALHRKLEADTSFLSYSLYRSAYAVLTVVTDRQLLVEWFEHIVVNLLIWARSSDCLAIFAEWRSVLLPRFGDLFRDKSYFSVLMAQFSIVFSAKDRYNEAAAMACITFVLGVTRLTFTESDLETLFSFAIRPGDPRHVVRLLYEVSRYPFAALKMTRVHFAVLHRQLFLVRDPEFVVLLILTVHNLSKADPAHMLSCALELARPSRDVVDSLINPLSECPDGLFLLMVLASEMGREASVRVADLAHKMDDTAVSRIVEHSNWYLFVLVLLYNLPPDGTNDFCCFIARCLVAAQDKSVFLKIVYSILMMTSIMEEHCPLPQLLRLLSSMLGENGHDVIPELVESCFVHFFFRFDVELHSEPLIDAYRNSAFCDPAFVPEHPTQRPKIVALPWSQFESLITDYFLDGQVFCRVRICGEQENAKLVDQDSLVVARSLMQSGTIDSPIYRAIAPLLTAFADRSEPLGPSLVSQLEAARAKFVRSFRSEVRDIQTDLRRLMKKAIDIMLSASDPLTGSPLNELMPTKVIEEQRRRSEILAPMGIAPLKRMNHCPTNIVCPRWKRGVRRQRLVDSPATGHGCILQHFVGERKYLVTISTEGLVLAPVVAGSPKRVKTGEISRFYVHDMRRTVDFFTTSAKNYRLKFEERAFVSFVQSLHSLGPRSRNLSLGSPVTSAIENAKAAWVSARLSNLDYIAEMNLLAGRSFRDPSYQPIAPAVLTDFNSLDSIVKTYCGLEFDPPAKTIVVLEKMFVGRAVVLAELFFDPDEIPEDSGLPPWAKNRFEFVSKARKILESRRITALLPGWIDRAFGFESPAIPRLFATQHPPHKLSPDMPRSLRYEINLLNTIKYATLFPVRSAFVKLGIVSDDLHFYSVAWEYEERRLTYTRDLIGSIDCAVDDLVFSQSSVGCAYSRTESMLFFLREDDLTDTQHLFCPTCLFIPCGPAVLYSPDRFAVYRLIGQGISSSTYLCHSERELLTMTASYCYQILALATVDGWVRIHDAKNGSLLNNYGTGVCLTQVLITDASGYVLALGQDMVYVFSVNGEFIKKERLTMPLVKAFGHTSLHKSDFVSFLSPTNEIGVFDPLFPSHQGIVLRVDFDVVEILYDAPHRMMVVCGTNGSIWIHAYSPDLK
jgi:hypothetical protein